jgi:hypothetical protein
MRRQAPSVLAQTQLGNGRQVCSRSSAAPRPKGSEHKDGGNCPMGHRLVEGGDGCRGCSSYRRCARRTDHRSRCRRAAPPAAVNRRIRAGQRLDAGRPQPPASAPDCCGDAWTNRRESARGIALLRRPSRFRLDDGSIFRCFGGAEAGAYHQSLPMVAMPTNHKNQPAIWQLAGVRWICRSSNRYTYFCSLLGVLPAN